MSDSAFLGTIPDQYENGLVPIFFAPYSADMGERVARLQPATILELAAGTGATTRELIARLPSVAITMTDLNPAMLETAARVFDNQRVITQACDATSLPFADHSFDAVVATFGVMFFPDRVAAYRETKRVLRDGGAFQFNVWGSPRANPHVGVVCSTYKDAVGAPCFLERVPFAYFDRALIEADLRKAGFTRIEMADVKRFSPVPSGQHFVRVLTTGSPFAADFDQLGARADDVRNALAQALERAYGSGEIKIEMSALVVEARA